MPSGDSWARVEESALVAVTPCVLPAGCFKSGARESSWAGVEQTRKDSY